VSNRGGDARSWISWEPGYGCASQMRQEYWRRMSSWRFVPLIEQHRVFMETAIEGLEDERWRNESGQVAPLAGGVADQKRAAVEVGAEADIANSIDEISGLRGGVDERGYRMPFPPSGQSSSSGSSSPSSPSSG
jgi:hypothetical protein